MDSNQNVSEVTGASVRRQNKIKASRLGMASHIHGRVHFLFEVGAAPSERERK